MWDGEGLLRARTSALAGTLNQSLVSTMVGIAEKQLGVIPISVLNKSMTPPSGDMHDFMAIASYASPCTTKCNKSKRFSFLPSRLAAALTDRLSF